MNSKKESHGKLLTNIKSTNSERTCKQLIHHNFPHHCFYSRSWQHPLQPPEPVVVKVGMETETNSRHSSRLTPVDASWALRHGSCSRFPAQHALLYEVSWSKQSGVSHHITDVRMGLKRSPDSAHGDRSEQRGGQRLELILYKATGCHCFITTLTEKKDKSGKDKCCILNHHKLWL